MKKIILAVLLTVILCGCGNSNYDISSNRHKGKLQAFVDYNFYKDEVMNQLIEIINSDDIQRLNNCFAYDYPSVNVANYDAKAFLDYIDGEVLEYKKCSDRLSKANGGLISNHYSIFFVRSYDVKTTNNEYRICYCYCYCNGNKDEEGMVSLGVSTKNDHDNGALMYYGIPGLYISTSDNIYDIEEIKANHGKMIKNGKLVPLEN